MKKLFVLLMAIVFVLPIVFFSGLAQAGRVFPDFYWRDYTEINTTETQKAEAEKNVSFPTNKWITIADIKLSLKDIGEVNLTKRGKDFFEKLDFYADKSEFRVLAKTSAGTHSFNPQYSHVLHDGTATRGIILSFSRTNDYSFEISLILYDNKHELGMVDGFLWNHGRLKRTGKIKLQMRINE